MVNHLIILFSILPIMISSNIFLYYKIFEIQKDHQAKYDGMLTKYDEMLKLVDSLKTDNLILTQKNNAFLNSIVKIDREQILNTQPVTQYHVDVLNIVLLILALFLIIYAYYCIFGAFKMPILLKMYKAYAIKLGSLMSSIIPNNEKFIISDSSYEYKIELNRFTGEASVLFRKYGETCEYYSLDFLINALSSDEAKAAISSLDNLKDLF